MPDIERGGPLSTSAIAGVSVALLGVVTVLGFLLYWYCARYRRRRSHADSKKRTTVSQLPSNVILKTALTLRQFLNISDPHLGTRERKHFSRIQSPLGMDEIHQDGPTHDPIRFPGLRGLPLRQGRDGEIKRKKSFLDMTVQVESEGDRRLMPLNHASMAGESPLTELVRYSPHDPPISSGREFEDTYGRHHFQRPSDGASQMTAMSAGTGMILPLSVGSKLAAASPRPKGRGGAV